MTKLAPPIIVRPDNKTMLRVWPDLALAIGRNEAMVILQIEYLLRISKNIRESRRWVYHSARSLQEEFFPFWSESTVNRALNSLVDKELLIEGQYNRHGYDKTSWYSLNLEKLKIVVEKSGIAIIQNEGWIVQNDGAISQFEQTVSQIDENMPQDEGTIPETPPKDFQQENTKRNGQPSSNTLSDWKQILIDLKGEMAAATFDNWLAGTFAIQSNDHLTIFVANDQAKAWLDLRLRAIVERAVTRHFGQPMKVEFEVISPDTVAK